MTEKITLITGGGRGLGRSAALALADAGHDVVITYRSSASSAEETVAAIQAKGRKAVALQLDTTEFDAFPAFVDQLRAALADTWGRDSFDHLFNNAGVGVLTPVGQTTAEQIDELLNTNLKGVVLFTEAVLPLLADGGRILNVSSGLVRYTAGSPYAVYAATKGAIEVYSRYLAAGLGARGIAVNTLAPGATATEFGGGYLQSDEFQQNVSKVTALGRGGQPDDIADAVVTLLSPGARWINAQRVEASGGAYL
ncbi:SDR family oxidoreductase [Schumannella luteola]|uniref:NAD(P)-dependent dehydrogenase (Short-subunit alcohol dehydrogenase family) n=1 Tax=Schumannella luteola TaxID=472059 RepID=A0A852Y970_9MICO|nr:SDR family oxidoreductase [Schumannella luteola]NYG97920.1 NAD(P)-dependent dehydrogenase (short-subunit alcohol dehydrogenase family) [Schumannella luteola]TPX03057.1 SDR family oxidoreductase [Schumannella luteola]